MPKCARVFAHSDTYHITTRGNRRGAVVFDEHDYRRWEWLLTRTMKRHRWRCLGYSLLPNHFHLLVACSNKSLGPGMNLLNGMYGQAFNRRHGYVGHVFQGRYGSEAVESDRHLLEAVRYIALNPVRASLCERPEEWPWASYAITFGLRADPVGVAIADLLAHFGSEVTTARNRLASFVADAI